MKLTDESKNRRHFDHKSVTHVAFGRVSLTPSKMLGPGLSAIMWLLLQQTHLSAAAGPSADASDTSVGTPIDRQVAVGDGRRMHIRCMGSGTPTVVLLAGLGEDADSWRGVQPRIAQLTRVCSYDRPGYGTSDGSSHPKDVIYTTSELEKLLGAARIGPPYVVVGHSYGGFEAIMFAHRNRDSTGALILVDSSFPHHDRIFAEASPYHGRWYSKLMSDRIEIARNCISMLRSGSDDCWPSSSKERVLSYLTSKLSVYENWEASSDQVEAIGTLGDLPLFVLTAGVSSPLKGQDREDY